MLVEYHSISTTTTPKWRDVCTCARNRGKNKSQNQSWSAWWTGKYVKWHIIIRVCTVLVRRRHRRPLAAWRVEAQTFPYRGPNSSADKAKAERQLAGQINTEVILRRLGDRWIWKMLAPTIFQNSLSDVIDNFVLQYFNITYLLVYTRIWKPFNFNNPVLNYYFQYLNLMFQLDDKLQLY